MKTTLFGSKIIEAAEEVLSIGYRAGSRNRYGEKLERVVQEYDLLPSLNQPPGKKYFGGKGKIQPDYCAIVVSVIMDRALKRYNGSTNTFHSASAGHLFDEAKRLKVRVDKNPQPGCLFVTLRNAGSGYHIGMVWKFEGNGFRTIEGNTYGSTCYNIVNGCKVKLGNTEYGILSRYRTKAKIHLCLHIEELFDKTLNEYPASETALADESDVCFVGTFPTEDNGSDGDIGTPDIDNAPLYTNDANGNMLDSAGNIVLTAQEIYNGCYINGNHEKVCQTETPTTTEDTILGLPKEAVYIGGAVVGFAGLCWLAGRGKKSSALSDKPKRRRKRKAKTTTKAKKRRKRK